MARRNDNNHEIEGRMKRMQADIENYRADSHAMKISFIAHDLEPGGSPQRPDLPADVLRDVQSLLDKRAKERRLGKRSRRVVEGSPAAPPPEEEEGYEYEPPVVPIIVFALLAPREPPLGLPEVAPPADLAPGHGGEPRD